MKPRRTVILCLLLLALIDAGQAPRCVAEFDYSAKIIKVEPPVEIARADSRESVPARVGLTLRRGDILRTRDRGKCAIAFPGGSQMVLKAATESSSLSFQSGGIISFIEGQLWACMRGEERITINTPTSTGKVYTQYTSAEIVLTLEDEKASQELGKPRIKNTEVSIISGDVTLANSMGSIRLSAPCKGMITPLASPMKSGELAESDITSINRWVNFEQKSMLIFVAEKQLGAPTEDGTARREIERIIEEGHYRVVTRSSISEFDDPQIRSLAKKADAGGMSAAAALGRKVGVDCFVMGAVNTRLLGEVYSGIVSCSASCELRLYRVEGGDLLMSKVWYATAIARTPRDASAGAIEKVLIDAGSTLILDINQSIADLVKPVEDTKLVEIMIQNASAEQLKEILGKLRKRFGTSKVLISSTEKGRSLLRVQTSASSDSILNELIHDSQIDFKVIGIDSDTITLRIQKK